MNRWHYIFLTTLLFGSAWVWYSRGPVTAVVVGRGPQPAVDYPAPDFALTTLAGEQISLAHLRGQPVVLNFWATWCDPCRREMPALQATADLYADKVIVLGVDQGEPAALVRTFVEEYGLTYPILLDAQFAVSQQYNIRGLPTTFFIDADGIVRFLWVGEMNRITLAEGIAKIR
jgi:cytochrome c biogenesis protein CcmG/thiol:disulfide interchange protein DsbE